MSAVHVLRMLNLKHEHPGRALFQDVNLSLKSGESVAIMGASGSGKSTLLSCALGLIRPLRGCVEVAGIDLARLKGASLAAHRANHIGMVFQSGELLSELSPVDNVALPALLAGDSRADAYARARDLLGRFGVPDSETSAELSGGERQRTAVARSMINSPSLILADEPTGALDESAREVVTDALFALPGQQGCGLLVVTHDPLVAQRADRMLVLNEGVLRDADVVSTVPWEQSEA
ncbi:ABC transporter ATP-binding protein [Streptomyces sp. NPDC093225]|uniref:ABC transporter ATP-binding protein n=1 Tax=Streptomyces sp. NPDC093225 TaxID=3366034 RepID=UPI0038182F75